MRIKVFCMQKDEEDILNEWIIYHSYLFGIENLYIIDNYSSHQSLEILNYYKNIGLNVYTRADYSKKGEYIYELIKEQEKSCDIAIPLDLDEFVGIVDLEAMDRNLLIKFARYCLSFDSSYYLNRYPEIQSKCKMNEYLAFNHFVKDGFIEGKWPCAEENINQCSESECLSYMVKNEQLILKNHPQWVISCDKERILNLLNHLPDYGRYAFSYYLSSRNGEMEYKNPIEDVIYFDKVDMENHLNRGNCNKKFFNARKLHALDHGHHYGRVEGLTQYQCLCTNLVLFHYHHRGIKKLIEKCKNDIMGLGHIKNIEDHRELKDKIKQEVPGAHNIATYLNSVLKGPYSLYMLEEDGLKITKLSEKIALLKENKM